jgi:hypothetical protein
MISPLSSNGLRGGRFACLYYLNEWPDPNSTNGPRIFVIRALEWFPRTLLIPWALALDSDKLVVRQNSDLPSNQADEGRGPSFFVQMGRLT